MPDFETLLANRKWSGYIHRRAGNEVRLRVSDFHVDSVYMVYVELQDTEREMKHTEQNKARFHVKVGEDQYGLLNLTFGTEPKTIQEAIEWATRRLSLENKNPVRLSGAVILDQREYDRARKEKGDIYFTDGVVAFHEGDGKWSSSGEELEVRDAELRELYQIERTKLSRARELRDEADLLEAEAEKAGREAAYREHHLNSENPSVQIADVEEDPTEMSAPSPV